MSISVLKRPMRHGATLLFAITFLFFKRKGCKILNRVNAMHIATPAHTVMDSVGAPVTVTNRHEHLLASHIGFFCPVPATSSYKECAKS